jgi:hypothetical protein
MIPYSTRRAALIALLLILALRPVSADSVLFIGNSYTEGALSAAGQHGGVPEMFAEIAQAKGRTVTTGTVVKGGKTWAYFLALPETETKLKAQPWTWVVLQDNSDRLKKDGLAAFLKDGDTFYDRIVQDDPAAKIALYETWARPAAFFHGDSAQSQQMITAVHAAYSQLRSNLSAKEQGNEARLAPVGTAFWSIEGKSAMSLHAFDLHHANIEGYYLAALVIYETIYPGSVIGATTTFFDGKVTIPDADAKTLQQAADAAVMSK